MRERHRLIALKYAELFQDDLLLGGFTLDAAADSLWEEISSYEYSVAPDEATTQFTYDEIAECVARGIRAALDHADKLVILAAADADTPAPSSHHDSPEEAEKRYYDTAQGE